MLLHMCYVQMCYYSIPICVCVVRVYTRRKKTSISRWSALTCCRHQQCFHVQRLLFFLVDRRAAERAACHNISIMLNAPALGLNGVPSSFPLLKMQSSNRLDSILKMIQSTGVPLVQFCQKYCSFQHGR